MTWAASWRISSRASGSRSVRIAISVPSGSGAARSRSSPSTRIASAALAKPGPIASAASAPLAPSSSSSGVPSGSFTVIFIAASIGLMLRVPTPSRRMKGCGPCGPHNPSFCAGTGLAHGDQRTRTGATDRAAALPDRVGAGLTAEAQPAERRAGRWAAGNEEADSARRPPPAALAGSMQTRPPRSSQAM